LYSKTKSNHHVHHRIDDDGPSGASRSRDEAQYVDENYNRAEICQFRSKNGASQGASLSQVYIMLFDDLLT